MSLITSHREIICELTYSPLVHRSVQTVPIYAPQTAVLDFIPLVALSFSQQAIALPLPSASIVHTFPGHRFSVLPSQKQTQQLIYLQFSESQGNPKALSAKLQLELHFTPQDIPKVEDIHTITLLACIFKTLLLFILIAQQIQCVFS